MKSKANEQRSANGWNQIPQETAQAIRKTCRRVLVRNLIKSLLFYAVSMAILFITGNSNDLFNSKAQPVWFWGVFLILAVFPFWKWK